MLILSRARGERICIGNNITVEVLGWKGGIVQLGIVADKDIPIMRKEILDKRARDAAAELPSSPESVQPDERSI